MLHKIIKLIIIKIFTHTHIILYMYILANHIYIEL